MDSTFLSESSEFLCNTCKNGTLEPLDYCERSIRYEGGEREWLIIPRHRCTNPQCRKIHRMLPDILIPYKHYSEETISGVLDGVVTPDDTESENYPCETTMERWRRWFEANRSNIEGQLKSIGYRLLGFGEELLRSDSSLLTRLRSSAPAAWLRTVLRYIYNSGNSLPPFYG